jgi:two-component system response regulator
MMNDGIEILLVEDDPRDVRLTVRELQNEHFRAHISVARDGEEALEYLFGRGGHADHSAHRQPHLVLLDLKLPKISGLEVLREIKSHIHTKVIPVVALTSSREEKDRAEGYRLGVNSYIQKPVDFDQFRQIIKTLGLYWLTMNQPPPDETDRPDSIE